MAECVVEPGGLCFVYGDCLHEEWLLNAIIEVAEDLGFRALSSDFTVHVEGDREELVTELRRRYPETPDGERIYYEGL